MIKKPFIKKYFGSNPCNIINIFLLALLLRLFLVWYLLGLDWRYDTGDGFENAVLLKHIFKNSCYMPPGQYLFAGLINQFFLKPNYFLLRIATIILSSLISINIYRIGKENFGTVVGLISGYASIFSLPFIFQSWTFTPATLAACLFSFFVLYFLRAVESPAPKNIILPGLFLGLSTITRTEMFVVLPIACVWFLVVRGTNREILKIILTMLVIFFLVVFSWTVRNYLVCNKFVIISSNGPINFFIGNNPLQTGSYFLPPATREEKQNYFLA